MKKFLLLSIIITMIVVSFIGCPSEISTQNPPEVSSTFPTLNSTSASINGIITATFNKDMDATTITGNTFTVSSGGVDIVGTITYDVPNKKAIFAPSENLSYSTEYSATLTTEVKSAAGIAMLGNKAWSFTTVSTGVGPEPVLLGTAANYVILAKSAISSVPASVITGDMGISPAAETFITGFTLTDATGYATSDQVTGFVYAADMVSPTSSNLTTAVEDMITAYNDAAGRLNPDELALGAGEIGSLTLDPGLYKWNNSVTINSDVTITGGANDTWIFQVSGNLTVGSASSIILSGGAQAKNIVWQVSGEVIMGTGAHFEGIVLTQTAVTMNTGATMNGRLLAQTAVSLDQATLTEPAL